MRHNFGRWSIAALTCAALVIGVLSTHSPLIVMAAVALGVLGLSAWLAPYNTALALVFLTAAFPKAGVKVDGFPFPVFLFGLIFAVLLLPRAARAIYSHTRGTVAALFVLGVWVAVRAMIMSPTAGAGGVFAYVAWAAIPAALLFASTRVELPDHRWSVALERGFMVAASFGLVQLGFGVEQTKVSGLTIAWGDSYAAKYNGLSTEYGPDLTKIMGTYQNGNIFGVTAAIFLIVAIARISSRSVTAHERFLLAFALISVGLSGSRTAIVVALAGVGLIFARRGSIGRKIGVIFSIALAGSLILQVEPRLAARYSLEQLSATGGAGRTDAWALAIDHMSISDWLFGAGEYLPIEGGVGLIRMHGLVGVLLLVGVVVGATRNRPQWRIPLLAVALGAAIDSSYSLFPTWFLPAAAAACPVVANFTHPYPGPQGPMPDTSTSAAPSRPPTGTKREAGSRELPVLDTFDRSELLP